MKAIIYNTGPDADGIASGEKKVVALEVALALAEKWSGMMKVLPYEPDADASVPAGSENVPAPAKPSKVAKVVQSIKRRVGRPSKKK